MGLPLSLPVEDTSAPAWNIKIHNKDDVGDDIGDDIGKFVRNIEYESTDGIADMARVQLVNPDSIVSDAKTFQPGNEMTIYAGYPTSVKPLGTVKIIRQEPNFPQDGEPTVVVEGYSLDSDMMENQPPKSKKKKGKGGRTFKKMTYADVVIERIKDYGFIPDIDPTQGVQKAVIQKAGMNDYQFVKNIANIVGYVMWVDKVPAMWGPAQWTFHFRHPSSITQDEEFVFKYDFYNDSNLLSFHPNLLVKGAKTKLTVSVKDRKTGKILLAEIEEENDKAPDMDASSDLAGSVDGEYTTASDIVLAFGGFTVDVISNRRFKIAADVEAWAKQFFRRTRDNFILSRGKTIGNNALAARQTHEIEGVGKAYDGKYYFSKVKHVIGADSGYICEFGARKILP